MKAPLLRSRRRRMQLSHAVAPAVAALLVSSASHGAPLEPTLFSSLGTLNIAAGSITINTDTLQITGAATFTGVNHVQGFGNPDIAVFTFAGFNINPGVAITVT